MTLACGIDHVLETECPVSVDQEGTDSADRVVFSIDAESQKAIRLIKFLSYHSSRTVSVKEQLDRAERVLKRAVRQGFDHLLIDQRRYLDGFWHRARHRSCGRTFTHPAVLAVGPVPITPGDSEG